MADDLISVVFSVQVCADKKANDKETVCITGDCEQLGRWQVKAAVPLRREPGSDVWSVTVSLPRDTRVLYRFALCLIDEPMFSRNPELRKVAVLKWETHLKPRLFFVNCNEISPETAIFGEINGTTCVDKGWLTDQTEIVLKIYNNPFSFLKRSLQERSYRIKCRPVDFSISELGSHLDDDESLQYEQRTSCHNFNVYAATLRSVSEARTRLQDVRGEVYNRDDYMLFRTQTFHPDTMGFILEIYLEMQDEPHYLGNACILPLKDLSSTGFRVVPINGRKNNPVGELGVEFLYIRPMSEVLCDFSVSYAKYWNNKRGSLDIGHRGMGSTKPRERVIPENTISSFNTAGRNGADFVEFDVQLCKDRAVVVYHDFKICLTMRKKRGVGNEFFETAVKDLTLEQLQRLKLDHAEIMKLCGHEVFANDDDHDVPDDWQPFPTLEQVFDGVDPLVGFDIEIKFPMALADGHHEMEHFFDQNLYVDKILSTVLKHAGSRRCMVTCFDPDICSLLRAKQCRYPVVLTCMGRNDVWTWYGDLRAQAYDMSFFYVICESVLGLSAYYDELMKNLELVQQIIQEGLLLFVWGRLTDRDTIQYVKSLGVHGLIYDRINEMKGTANVFHLEQEIASKVELSKMKSTSESPA